MKHSSKRLAPVACIAACLATSTSGMAMTIDCPARITMQPAVIEHAPDGWQPLQRQTMLAVQSVVMTVGTLEKPMQLKPDIRIVKGSKTFAWTFGPRENEEGIWLYCGYGNTILLAQKLSVSVYRCQAREATADDGQTTMTTSCQ